MKVAIKAIVKGMYEETNIKPIVSGFRRGGGGIENNET